MSDVKKYIRVIMQCPCGGSESYQDFYYYESDNLSKKDFDKVAIDNYSPRWTTIDLSEDDVNDAKYIKD